MFHKFFRNKKGEVVIWQFPNLPLWGWAVFGILSKLFKLGALHNGFHFLSRASLFAWAFLEIHSGNSPFRRVLGALIMIFIIASAF